MSYCAPEILRNLEYWMYSSLMAFTLWCLDHLASRRFSTVFSCPEVSCDITFLVVEWFSWYRILEYLFLVFGFIFFYGNCLYHFSEVFNSSFFVCFLNWFCCFGRCWVGHIALGAYSWVAVSASLSGSCLLSWVDVSPVRIGPSLGAYVQLQCSC